jgi:hypothetical protein
MTVNKDELKKLLEEKPSECVFVETGTYMGETIDYVLGLGVTKIRTIEGSPYHHSRCLQKYRGNTKVKLYYGSSRVSLFDMCSDIDGHIVFWLDAHYSGGQCLQETGLDRPYCPLYEELEQIKRLKANTHTIMIDDIRDVRNGHMGVSMDEIYKRLHDINPNYTIYFVDGHAENDIMIAKI